MKNKTEVKTEMEMSQTMAMCTALEFGKRNPDFIKTIEESLEISKDPKDAHFILLHFADFPQDKSIFPELYGKAKERWTDLNRGGSDVREYVDNIFCRLDKVDKIMLCPYNNGIETSRATFQDDKFVESVSHVLPFAAVEENIMKLFKNGTVAKAYSGDKTFEIVLLKGERGRCIHLGRTEV